MRRATTVKFTQRRDEILNVASELINVGGARGVTLSAVAKALDLDTSSVTYYFPKRDHLVAACVERSHGWPYDAAKTASEEPDSRDRVRSLLAAHFARYARQRSGALKLAIVSDVHSLDPDLRAPLSARFREIVGLVRGFFDHGTSASGRLRAAMSGISLLSVVFWMSAWIDHYLESDFERLQERLLAQLEYAFAATDWASDITLLEEAEPQDAQSLFLFAATNQINLHGYRGASVAGIAAALGVSIGSFYHHLENKDDPVLACFPRSFDLIDAAQARASGDGGGYGDRIGRMADMLIVLQFRAASPLLRFSAYQALPPDLRQRMLAHTGRVTRHISGLSADGMSHGEVCATDPALGGQTVMALLDGAAELRGRAAKRPLDEAVAAYSRNLRKEIYEPPRGTAAMPASTCSSGACLQGAVKFRHVNVPCTCRRATRFVRRQ